MPPISCVQETDDWLVLDKPRGISVHNRKGEDLLSWARQNVHPDSVPVHRIDAGTAGLVLLAKTETAAKQLGNQFAQRTVEKRYLAKVELRKNHPEVGDSGLWRWPLTNRAEGRGDPKGFWRYRIPCQSRWQVKSVKDDTALIEVQLLTGRKHQIRRHCAIYGWPLVGDPRYGKQDTPPPPSDCPNLLAAQLGFTDPQTGEQILVQSKFTIDFEQN